MIQLTQKIDTFFSSNFKKKFLSIISIPLFITSFYLIDYYMLPESKLVDTVEETYGITVSQSVVGTSARSSKYVGKKYVTKNGYSFSSQKSKIGFEKVNLSISPIFKRVKSVNYKTQQIKISSGMNGVSKIIFVICYSIIIISILYTVMVKEVTENSKLNLIYFNIFMFCLWGWIMLKFGV